MQLEIYSTENGFRDLRVDWNKLTTNPLNSFDWHFEWWNNFGSGDELKLFVVRKDKQVIGIAPLFQDSWCGQKRLRLLGSGSTCTDYPQIIAAQSDIEQVSMAITEEFQRSNHANMIELEGVRSGEDVLTHLHPEFKQAYWRYDLPLDATWTLPIGVSWDEFIASSNKSLRRKIRKAIKKLDSGEAKVQSTQLGLEFDTAFDALVELHQKRFVGKGEPGVFRDPRFSRFLRDAASSLCQHNQAEILVAQVDGRMIGAQIYLLDDSGPQLYQAGICPDSLQFEPGHLMFTYAIRKAIENDYQQFDFLRGDEGYKPFWGASRQPLVKTRYVSKKLMPSFANQSFRVLRAAKHRCLGMLNRSQKTNHH